MDALALVPLALVMHLLVGAWMISTDVIYAQSLGGRTIGGYGVIPGLDQLLPWFASPAPAAPTCANATALANVTTCSATSRTAVTRSSRPTA